MFPIDAAVIPLPSEETTPPVTKTYFDIDDLQGGFSNLTGSGPAVNISHRLTRLPPLSNWGDSPLNAPDWRSQFRRTPLRLLSPWGGVGLAHGFGIDVQA